MGSRGFLVGTLTQTGPVRYTCALGTNVYSPFTVPFLVSIANVQVNANQEHSCKMGGPITSTLTRAVLA